MPERRVVKMSEKGPITEEPRPEDNADLLKQREREEFDWAQEALKNVTPRKGKQDQEHREAA